MKLNNIRYTDEDINNLDDYYLKEIEEYREIEKSLNKEIDKLTAERTEWEERTYCWQDRAENLQIVLDKIKEYITTIDTNYEIGCWTKNEFGEETFLNVKEDILKLLEE